MSRAVACRSCSRERICWKPCCHYIIGGGEPREHTDRTEVVREVDGSGKAGMSWTEVRRRSVRTSLDVEGERDVDNGKECWVRKKKWHLHSMAMHRQAEGKRERECVCVRVCVYGACVCGWAQAADS
ncbi:uncharacterized protein K489DRAFT_151258 [Dissoconium aciculare CBS 342.82]|uniref:Uncharacterized protein n=1 Tax=Dissoconium aciculare CBS 342.82 TaxID=1314786 RepID=A0A6J3MEC0_9PEZI|nr:uncharacterized protein K489DRAFT_151258 [Dissoconium aciculare CBS 342.82]KAF1825197.1 hypothetical protein K489DRAFT_151258 [Dissoconium aciculare CBS 342.82]